MNAIILLFLGLGYFSFGARTIKITNKQVHQTLVKNKSEINECYQSYLSEGFRSYGKVVMRWNIHPNGKATHVKTIKTIDKYISNCLDKKIRTWSFPKTDTNRIAEVEYPFIFRAQRVRK